MSCAVIRASRLIFPHNDNKSLPANHPTPPLQSFPISTANVGAVIDSVGGFAVSSRVTVFFHCTFSFSRNVEAAATLIVCNRSASVRVKVAGMAASNFPAPVMEGANETRRPANVEPKRGNF